MYKKIHKTLIGICMNNYKIESLFPTPVFCTELGEGISAEQLDYVQSCSKNVIINTGHNTSGWDVRVLDNPVMANIKELIQSSLDTYVREIDSPKLDVKPYITQSWFNYTIPGQTHHKHFHPNSYLSGVFYINADKESDKIFFHKEGYNRIYLDTENYNTFNSGSWWFPVGTGDLVLFQSSLQHSVVSTVNTGTRISIAFNSFIKGQLSGVQSTNKDQYFTI